MSNIEIAELLFCDTDSLCNKISENEKFITEILAHRLSYYEYVKKFIKDEKIKKHYETLEAKIKTTLEK